MTNSKVKEIVYTNTYHVKCSGIDEISDHPLIYLQVDSVSKQVVCPYCSRMFQLKNTQL